MDYSQVCQGWIYYIRNKVNGKMYIGKTNNFEKRKYQHFNLPKKHSTLLYHAFNKYGKENFEMVSLVTFYAVNNNVLNILLNWLEKYYIKKYNTFEKGYNLTEGGEGTSGYNHSELTKMKISNSSLGKKFTDSHIRNLKLSHLGKEVPYSEKPVLQYSLDGEFIKEYKSIAEANSKILQNRQGYAIYLALNHKNHYGAGYLWEYKEGEDFPQHIEAYVGPHSKKGNQVYYYTKEGDLIGSYKNPMSASKSLGVPLKQISQSLNYKVKSKHRKNYWSYELLK